MGGGAIPCKSPFPDSKSDEAVKDAWQLWREEFAGVPQHEASESPGIDGSAEG
jgi:hypothetical protein